MILTVCMSPSVDVTVEVDALNIGKMNVVKSKSLSFTGKAINVAIGVSRLGYEAKTTGFMYRENGASFEAELAQEGVPSAFIWNEGRVRAVVKPEKLNELLSAVKMLSKEANVTVISGGLPRGVDVSYYRDILCAVDKRSLRIADTEGARLFAALDAGVDLVKPNREELEHSLGRELKDRWASTARSSRTEKRIIIARASTWRSTPRWARATGWSRRPP